MQQTKIRNYSISKIENDLNILIFYKYYERFDIWDESIMIKEENKEGIMKINRIKSKS
jgi:hypothetical protein